MAEKSNMSREWIERVWKDNPIQKLQNGNVRTGPVRLAFCHVLERQKPGKDGKERSYGAVLLFPEGADLSVLKAEAKALIQENMPAALTSKAVFDKLNNPFKDQSSFTDPEGQLYDGFVGGRTAIAANSSKSQPPVVDQKMAPVIDKRHIYSGCWAIVTLAPRWFNVDTNKGPTFYLQSVMVVADDENLGGAGAANPSADFAGVKIDDAVNPAAAFGVEGATAGAQEDVPFDVFG
jgi:hypothetical protein